MPGLLALDRSDHPLVDPERRVEILRDLPADPLRALEALTGFVEAVHELRGLAAPDRTAAVLDIDATGQTHVRKLVREFPGIQGEPARAQQAWTVVRRFLDVDSLALATLVDACDPAVKASGPLRASLPVLAVRTMRVCALLSKWLAMRYGPHDRALWRRAARTLELAERTGILAKRVAPYPGIAAQTSIDTEFVRLAVLAASSPGALPLEHIEALDRIVAFLAPQFDVVRLPREGTHYWIDLADARPPARVARALRPRDSLRFVGGVRAVRLIERMQAILTTGERIVDGPAVDDLCDPASFHALLEHMRLHWGAAIPLRRHPHHRLQSAIDVVQGFDDVLDALLAADAEAGGVGPAMPATRSWTTENVSTGGFAALVPVGCDQHVRIGGLLAAKAPTSRVWQLGVIRRLERLEDERLFVAVELIPGTPAPVEVIVQTAGRLARLPEVALVVGDPAGDAPVMLALRSGVHAPGDEYLPESLYRGVTLVPDTLPRRGADYELLRCRPRLPGS